MRFRHCECGCSSIRKSDIYYERCPNEACLRAFIGKRHIREDRVPVMKKLFEDIDCAAVREAGYYSPFKELP